MTDPERRFTGMPVTTDYIDGRQWRLARDVSYRTVAGPVSTVRAGFIFDWASTPRLVWRLTPPAGLRKNPYGIAALWHDWLYCHQRIQGRPITRATADGIFLEIMRYTGVRRSLALAMHAGVRAGGWLAWRKASKRPQEWPTPGAAPTTLVNAETPIAAQLPPIVEGARAIRGKISWVWHGGWGQLPAFDPSNPLQERTCP